MDGAEKHIRVSLSLEAIPGQPTTELLQKIGFESGLLHGNIQSAIANNTIGVPHASLEAIRYNKDPAEPWGNQLSMIQPGMPSRW